MPRSVEKPKHQSVDAVAFAASVLMQKLDYIFTPAMASWGRHGRGFRLTRVYRKETRQMHLTIYPHDWPEPSRVWCQFALGQDKEWLPVEGSIIAPHIKLLCHHDYPLAVPFKCTLSESRIVIQPTETNTPVAKFVQGLLEQRP